MTIFRVKMVKLSGDSRLHFASFSLDRVPAWGPWGRWRTGVWSRDQLPIPPPPPHIPSSSTNLPQAAYSLLITFLLLLFLLQTTCFLQLLRSSSSNKGSWETMPKTSGGTSKPFVLLFAFKERNNCLGICSGNKTSSPWKLHFFVVFCPAKLTSPQYEQWPYSQSPKTLFWCFCSCLGNFRKTLLTSGFSVLMLHFSPSRLPRDN